MKTFVTPFRVGLLVLAAVGFLLAFLLFVRRGAMGADTITVYAMFRDASGLGNRSRVQVAGIPVGEIREITLVGTRARVTLRVRKDIGLRTDATLIKRTESFLGDYLLDLTVGTPGAPPIRTPRPPFAQVRLSAGAMPSASLSSSSVIVSGRI